MKYYYKRHFGRYSKDTSFKIDGEICYNMQVIKHNIRKIPR